MTDEYDLTSRAAELETYIIGKSGIISDYAFWSQCPYWTLQETALLSIGLEPREVSFQNIVFRYRDQDFLDKCYHRLDIVRRATEIKDLGAEGPRSDRLRPREVLMWAQTIAMRFPPCLEAKVLGQQSADVSADTENGSKSRQGDEQFDKMREERAASKDVPDEPPVTKDTLKTKERNSLLKMVLGMTCCIYGCKPDEDISKFATELSGDLDGRGVHLDPDTVRKYLREAADLADRQLR